MAAFSKENDFSNHILYSVKETDIFCIHVVDDAKRIVAFHPECAHLIEQKCYDMGFLYKGKFAGIELKNVSDGLTFNTSRIEAHQLKNLKKTVMCGGLGYVLVRFKQGLTKQGQKRLKTSAFAIDKCYAMDVRWICKKKETSFPIEMIMEECIEIPINPFTKKYELTALWPTKVRAVKK